MPTFPRALATQFLPSCLVNQYILCRDESHVPDGWDVHNRGEWVLGIYPGFPVSQTPNAWIVGQYLEVGGERVGRSILIEGSRLELDAAGCLSAFYCPSQEIVAASPMLIPYTDETDDNVALIEAMGIPERNGFYPFGTTPRHGVYRLLPNHRLDLDTWEATRTWPTAPITINLDTDATVGKIAAILKKTIAAACNSPVSMGLTAGRDSRMLLACAKDNWNRIQFHTLRIGDHKARVDVRMARRLAKHFGLHHEVRTNPSCSESNADLWLYMTGCAVGERRGMIAFRGCNASTGWHITGLCAEVGRSFYWDETDDAITTQEVVTRLKVPMELLPHADRWRRMLPIAGSRDILDLSYLENRVGCWAGTSALARGTTLLSPFANRRVIELMLSLPHEYRFRQQLAREVIAIECPELLKWRFNPVSKIQGRIRQTLSNAPYVWRFAKYF